jgi:hypothetical protein
MRRYSRLGPGPLGREEQSEEEVTDKNQELAQAVESLLEHFGGMRDSLRDVERLAEELSLNSVFDFNIVSIHTGLMVMSGDVVGLKSDVVEYFSNRAGGK